MSETPRRADSRPACCRSATVEPFVDDVDGESRFFRARIAGGRNSSQTFRCSHLRWPWRTLNRAGSRSANSTTSLSRYGTRTSRPCAIESLSAYISSSSGSEERISSTWNAPSSSQPSISGARSAQNSQDAVPRALGSRPSPEQAVDVVTRHDREHVLVSLQAVLDVQRIDARFSVSLRGRRRMPASSRAAAIRGSCRQ